LTRSISLPQVQYGNRAAIDAPSVRTLQFFFPPLRFLCALKGFSDELRT
jgi:hypothetical protein